MRTMAHRYGTATTPKRPQRRAFLIGSDDRDLVFVTFYRFFGLNAKKTSVSIFVDSSDELSTTVRYYLRTSDDERFLSLTRVVRD